LIYLSVIIPAYNEERRIDATLEAVASHLEQQRYSWEIIVADDGSTDRTAWIVGDWDLPSPAIRLISLPHRGKGSAVKAGMLAARGEWRFMCDADLSMPIEQIGRFFPHTFAPPFDILIGSRDLAWSRRIGEPLRRKVMGRVFNGLIRALAVPGIRDTQCGFKMFRGAIVEQLFQRQTLPGFGFDVELLYLARRMGLSVGEVAIDWHYRDQSKVRPVRDSLTMAADLFRIRWRHMR
jgi:dolichyl-phosphate beta-glucosyltransferase